MDSLSACRLCPRKCGVNRVKGLGFCGSGAVPVVYRYGKHHGEEPPVSGTRGSGNIFFSRCTLSCVYCQNHPWSQGGAGSECDSDTLVSVMRELAEKGCHNWNMVTPTPWIPWISDAIESLEKDGLSLPLVYNTSGFERREVLASIDGLVDVYLTDLRYSSESSAETLSGSASFVDAARDALLEMWRQVGPLELDAEGIAVSGVICRVLVLPGLTDEATGNLEWIRENLGTDLSISLMAQYVPAYRAGEFGELGRRLTVDEYESVADVMNSLGFSSGWLQHPGETGPEDLVGYRMEQSLF